MTDVMQHKLTTSRRITRRELEDAIDHEAFANYTRRSMGAEVGALILDRWPPERIEHDESGDIELRASFYVFAPAELAEYTSNVRDTAIAEVMALADEIVDKPPTLENDA